MTEPLVSIVIPSRNEAEDIARTLEACLGIDYGAKEIIVVDDSTDRTPEIVAQFAPQGVRLIHRETNTNGCCGARNVGMRVAGGEVVVLMNGDNVPRPDFLRRVMAHYEDGADYLVVRSTVLNRDNVWSDYIAASGRRDLQGAPLPYWSEGFSCRRSAAAAIGFIPGDFPVPFCRDWMLGERLSAAGYERHVDLTIVMEHISPSDLKGFWRNQVWRASFSSPFAHYFRGLSVPVVALRETAKALRTMALTVLLVPVIARAVRSVRYARRGWRSLPGFVLADLVRNVASIVGNFKGLLAVARTRRLVPRVS